MDMGIVNAGMIGIYEDISKELRDLAEDLIFNRDPLTTDKLIGYVDDNKLKVTAQTDILKWRQNEPSQRISYSLVKGISEYI